MSYPIFNWAWVVNGAVTEIAQTMPNPPDDWIMFDSATIPVEVGWLYDGQDFSEPPVVEELTLFAVVIDNVVTNRTMAYPSFGESQGWVAIPDTVQIGWIWDGEKFSAPPLPEPQKSATITKMQFLTLMSATIGKPRTIQLLGSPTEIAVVYAAAEKIDYDDVFVCVDGDPEQPCYSAQLLAAEAVTQAEVDTLQASWPTE